jgi:dihydropteroate synthase
MGILNVTPDSFSDGGRFMAREQALDHAQAMIAAGADLLDIGGESTRPGAPAVPLAEELARVIGLVTALRDAGVPLSVDTCKPAVMRAALDAGADMINDIRAFQAPGALDAVRASGCAVCAMHMLGTPATMQCAPVYSDVLAEVRAFLVARTLALQAAGVAAERICVDPGFGFGKNEEHNYTLLARLGEVAPPGLPLLVGMSRKSMLGAVTGRPAGARLAASIGAAVCAAEQGAALIRVHDVAETVDALRIWSAVQTARAARPAG